MSSAKSHSQMIPSMKRIFISEASQMPENYSTTPNGTCYGTTPGGKFLSKSVFLNNLLCFTHVLLKKKNVFAVLEKCFKWSIWIFIEI